MLSGDLCVIGGEHHFVRYILLVPIVGTRHELGFGVWVSQAKANFDLYAATLRASPERVTSGYLAHQLPNDPDTLNMRICLHWQPGGSCPIAELIACEHPLFHDWSNGITRDRVISFAEQAIHPDARFRDGS